MLALSTFAGTILMVLGVVFIVAAGVAITQRGRTRAASPDIPRAMRPGPSDPALETPLLQKLQGWGVILVAFFVIWVPFVWLREPSANLQQEKDLKTAAIARGQRATEFYTAIGKRAVRLHKEVPGHVANRLQAALGREVYHLVSEGVVSVADVDAALSWGPGLRWGIMGQVLLNHLGGGQGGIEHFFQQFTGPMTAWWKVLGSPVLTPEVQQMLTDGVHAEVGSRSIDELEAERDEVLLGLLELRAQAENRSAGRKSAARVG